MTYYMVNEKSKGIVFNHNYRKKTSHWFTCKDELFTATECRNFGLNTKLFTKIETSPQNTYKIFGNRLILDADKVEY